MKVSDLQPHELFTAQAEETLEEAADRMSWHQVGALPVFEGQHLVGIITERDRRRRGGRGLMGTTFTHLPGPAADAAKTFTIRPRSSSPRWSL
jgi:CBS-domain-containing membrane protein